MTTSKNIKTKDSAKSLAPSFVLWYNKYTWHETEDSYTAQLVDSNIHTSISHYGGVSVVNRMSKTEQARRIYEAQQFLNSRRGK